MHKVLLECDINQYDLDDFSVTSLKVFNKQEEIYKNTKYYNLLSLISIILLDLNIISLKE